MNNPPAFPLAAQHSGGVNFTYAEPGMTLRDYFAAKALQGMLANHDNNLVIPDSASAAFLAYKYADAMLLEREKPHE